MEYSIGELARLSGLTVKAVRHYSDLGLVQALLSVVNGWPPPESLTPVLDWFIRALRPRLPAVPAGAVSG